MTAIISATIGALGAIIAAFVGAAMMDRRDKSSASKREIISEGFKVTSVLNELLVETGAARCLILRASNGGDVLLKAIREGKPITSSVELEVHSPDAPSIREKWQNRSVDPDYKEILSVVLQEGSAINLTAQMENSSMLRALYESNDVVCGELHDIHSTSRTISGTRSNVLIYLALHYGKPIDGNAAHRRAAIDQALNTLRTRYKYIWKNL